MWFVFKALRLAGEKHTLELENARLRAQLATSREAVQRIADEREQYRRDAECLALMARDRNTALAFLRDRHRIDALEETT